METNTTKELERLRSLREHQLLDTPAEPAYEALVTLASQICGTPIALVSLIDQDRQWFKASIGLEAKETPRDIAFCHHAIEQDDLFIVPNALEDVRFANNPLVTSAPDIRFYTGTPLRSQSAHKLGTLCVIDRVPRRLSLFQEQALRTLADQVEVHFALRMHIHHLRSREAEVRRQRDALLKLEEEKKQLTLLIAHDLKNPLATLMPSAELLLDEEHLSPDGREIVQGIAASTRSMERLVMNLLDVSRADDGGLRLMQSRFDVVQLMEETRRLMFARAQRHGHRLALKSFLRTGERMVEGDRDLLRRVLDNLFDNAFKYGPAKGEISLEARVLDGELELRVCDEGSGVPESHRLNIFEKYKRLSNSGGEHSRGLGLAYCKLAIEAHGGRIWVEDHLPQGSAFCIRPPRAKDLAASGVTAA